MFPSNRRNQRPSETAARLRKEESSILAYRHIRTQLLKVISLNWTDMRNYRRCVCPSKHRVTSAYSDCCWCPHCIEMVGTSGLHLLTIFIARHFDWPLGTSSTLQKLCIQSRRASVDLPTIWCVAFKALLPVRTVCLFMCFANSHIELRLFHLTSCRHVSCHKDALFSARLETAVRKFFANLHVHGSVHHHS
jgi:hypothetical protein